MRIVNEVEVCDMSKKLIMGVVMALVLVVCIPQTVSAKTKWKLSATSKNLQVGKTSKLTVKNVPKKAKVKWKSSKKSVVKIIKTGKKSVKVKACKSGTAYVTVRYKGKTKRCKIKVTAKTQTAPQADIPRLNATSVDIYHVDDALKPYMTVDPAHKTTFQFQVTGTKLEVEKWKVSTESGLVISDDGLLTTVWGPGYGTPYLTSTVTAILENNQRLTATVRVYAESNFYVDKVLTAFEQRNITSSMTGKEKVERAAAYIGETTDYQVNQNNWQMLLLGGKGDCRASRVLLAYMCKHMGMKAEPCGEFEYHGETLVKTDGIYYIVITGFAEPRPRRYVITEITDQSQLQKIMEDNNLSPAMFD